MISYMYITLALLSNQLNYTDIINISIGETNETCKFEEYRVCYIPDHCIYFQRTFDTTNKYISNIHPILYYDLVSDYYSYNFMNVNLIHPLVQYYKKLEVASSSVPLFDTNYTYCKHRPEHASELEINKWMHEWYSFMHIQ